MTKIKIGISSCLLGEEVRYDGGHKRHSYIEQTLGRFFEFRPFCPEVASGMGIPRPAVQLREMDDGAVRCVGVKDRRLDVTEQLQHNATLQHAWLRAVCGYIFKKDSPSCGMARVRVYRGDNAQRNGVGIFADYVQNQFPYLPTEEEGRLGDPALRENFIQRVFVMQRWQELCEERLTPHRLMAFHSQHKLIAMSHDQNQARALGRLVAEVRSDDIETVAQGYLEALMRCLTIIATRCNHVNVLQHIQGYLKRALDSDDKHELIETIDDYRQGKVPLLVPITLLKHHFRKQPDPFIKQSYYMMPYPDELAMSESDLNRYP